MGKGQLLQISTLGGLTLAFAGEPLRGLATRKVEALLVYLACTHRDQPREVLAELLWPERTQDRAMSSLRVALTSLRKHLSAHITITRNTVGINPDAALALDIAALEENLSAGKTEAALALYQGEFLEGFYVRGCPGFDDWASVERERLHRIAIDALQQLVAQHLELGSYQEGIQCASRLLQLDPLMEEAYQHMMRLLAFSGLRSAALTQYETCCRVLDEELGVAPSEETVALYERIRAGELDAPVLIREPEIVASIPAFLKEKAESDGPARPVFVARERELAQLEIYLEGALGGKGQVAFVTGGPGRGKTAFMTEFAHRAMDQYPELLLGMGNCNAYSGVGDPYLPFREVMGMLTGDVEARWASGTITREHAQRLWAALPLAAQALLDHGPHLMGIFVPGSSLLSRAAAAVPEDVEFLRRLQGLFTRRRAEADGLDQSFIFEQYTNTLQALEARHPLLLLLDDLQWADAASIGLLFHLGRRLAGCRMLIMCAYRPEEIALYRGGERHPMEKLLSEFKLHFGDVWVDLALADETEGQRFVETLLDAEPNRLDNAFRAALLRHTQGHPLFTVELLRSMQDRGDLIKDDDGHWITGPELDWESLPPRVEAVIEERIGRLEEELRDILSVASVEGEEFTAQVVARVQAINERQLLRKLSRELEKRHKLVREHGLQSADGRQLSRYRFSHALFQQFLYNDLSEGERTLLHRDIGAILEELYEGRTEEIAVQLARHYAYGADANLERHYNKLAGQRAALQYGNQEALRYLNRALELTPHEDYAERFAILLSREKVYDTKGDREAQYRDLKRLDDLAETLNDDELRAEAALRRANYCEATDDFQAVIANAQDAVRLAQAVQDRRREAVGYLLWGGALGRQAEYEAARVQLERALALARAIRTPATSAIASQRLVADILRKLGEVALNQADFASAAEFHGQALSIDREIGDRRGEGRALNNLGVVCLEQGDLAGAKTLQEQALPILREIGDRRGESRVLNNLGVLAVEEGDLVEATAFYELARVVASEIGTHIIEALAVGNLGEVYLVQGDYTAASAYYQQALDIFRKVGHRRFECAHLYSIGEMLLAQGSYEDARNSFEEALRVSRDIGYQRGENPALSGLSLLYHYLGDDEKAREYGERALVLARETGEKGRECDALTRLGHALAGSGQFSAATECYQSALELRRELGQPHLAVDPLAGLARVKLAQGDLSQAHRQVLEILSDLRIETLARTPQPLEIYLTCYRVLEANRDPRAQEVLDTAYGLLHERAAKLCDEQKRCSFLENVSAHREILEIWERERGSA